MQTHMWFVHVGTGEYAEIFNTTQIDLSISSVEEYTVSNIAPRSLFEDLLIEEQVDGKNEGKVCWEFQWLMDPKGDRRVTKYGKHSSKYGAFVTRDAQLVDLVQSTRPIHLQIVFDAAMYRNWEQKQRYKENIPIPNIIGSKETSECLQIEIDYPPKKIYEICYKIYETGHNCNETTDCEWKQPARRSNEILLNNLWQFKKYTLEVCLRNQYSNVYGISRIESGYQIKSHKIIFDHDDDRYMDLGGNIIKREEFETFDHDSFYFWCKRELTSNDVFDDIRNMEYGKITLDYMLAMIRGFKQLIGDTFLWKTASSVGIIGNLLKVPEGKKFKQENENNDNKDAFSFDLCCSILSRLRIIAFKKESNLGYVPSNDYVIYFWCFFDKKPQSDIYIRCCELSSSLVLIYDIVYYFRVGTGLVL